MQSNYKIPSPSLADCCFCLIVFCFVFHRPFVRNDERRLLGFIVVFGGRTSLQWLRAVPRLQNKLLCLVSFPPTPNSWLLCPPVDPRPLDLLLNRFGCVSDGLFRSSPLPSTSCVLKSCLNPPSLHLRAAVEAVSSAPWQNWRPHRQRRQGKASAMVSDGSCGHRPMIWRPSDMVLVVDRWVDCFVVRKKVRYFCTYLTKKWRSAPTPNFALT